MLPTKKEWIDFLKFRKGISVKQIVENSFDQKLYDKAVKMTRENIEKDYETIERCIEFSEKKKL